MNKNKVSIKTIIIIVILVLVGVLGVLGINTARTYLSGASSDTMAKNVLAKASEDGKSAVVTWISDKATVGVVEYGTTPASLLLRAPENGQTTSHSLTLSPLKANTNYYFRIRVGDEVFDNNGIPYSFKTKAGVAIPTVTVMPTVAAIPTTSSTSPNGCDRSTDYNKDGIVNSLDYMACLKVKPTPSVAAGKCPSGVDYNKDGVINSLDKLKCLQDNK
jgi:hypothetical protein